MQSLFKKIALGTVLILGTTSCSKVEIDTQKNQTTQGTSKGADEIIYPMVPYGLTVIGATPTSITLSWEENLQKVFVATYEIRVTGTNAPAPVQIDAPATTVTITGLTENTEYSFGIRACDASNNCSDYSDDPGQSGDSGSVSGETPAAPDTQAPTVPGGLASNGATMTSISLMWNASTDNVGVTYYNIRRNNNNALVTKVNAPLTSGSVGSLTAGTSYQFDIQACDATDNCSAYSLDINASTMAAPDTQAPTVPGGLMSNGKSMNSVSLIWSASTDNVGVTRYEIRTNSTGTPVSVNHPTVTRNMTGLAASTPYQFQVRACDAANNCSAYSSNISVTTDAAPDTTAPSVPGGVNTSGATDSTINLGWSISTDNIGVTRYEIQTNSTGTPVSVNHPTVMRTMSGLAASTPYQFRVRACDAANNCSAYSSNVSGTTTATPDTTAPSVPTGLAATGTTYNSTNLGWNASTDNIAVTRYDIRTNSTGTPVSVNHPTVTRTMSGLNASTPYQFQVRSCDGAGNCSAYSSNITVSTPAAPDTTAPSVPAGLGTTNLQQTTITFNWSASTDNVAVTGYDVSIDNGAAIAVTTTSYNATGFAAGSSHNFRVRAKDAAGNLSSYATAFNFTMASATDTTAPTVPSGLMITNIQPTTATFTWNAATDNIGVTGYDVSIDNGAAIAVTGTTYAANGFAAGTSHTYRVRAKDAAGNLSSYSGASTFTTSSTVNVPTVPATLASKVSVPMYADVQSSSAKITVRWAKVNTVTQNSGTLSRKPRGGSSWSSIYTFGANINSYEDTGVSVNTLYEYKIQQSTSNGTAYGYLTTGIDVVNSGLSGKIIVVADNTLYNASSTVITTLKNDLVQDGWIPSFLFVARTDTATAIRGQIQTIYNTDAANFKHVLIVGHVPVPYSGNVSPDGHSEHNGAWPADNYYGEMTSTWTQGGGNVWAGWSGERNGYPATASKFSPSSFPSSVEMGVGRIDFYNMPAFSLSETQLNANYLTKMRNFMRGQVSVQMRAHMADNLEWAGSPFSRSAWSTASGAVGPANITAGYYSTPNYQLATNQSYLWGYAGGGGSITSADGHGNTSNYASVNFDMLFNMFFGSYFGDWDMKDNLLRAVIATPGKALVNIHSGAHQFYGQSMAIGGTIGESMIDSLNNSDSIYNASNGGCCGSGNIFMSIMGAPMLRHYYPAMPSNLTSNGTNVSWSAASGVDGYNVYQVTSSGGNVTAITKLNSSLVTSTTYAVSGGTAGKEIMVRAVKRYTSNAGSYDALSAGIRGTY